MKSVQNQNDVDGLKKNSITRNKQTSSNQTLTTLERTIIDVKKTRPWRYLTLGLCLLNIVGIILFLTFTSYETAWKGWHIPIQVYYSLVIVLMIFGFISILKYNHKGIFWFTISYFFNAFVSTGFSVYYIYTHSNQFFYPPECDSNKYMTDLECNNLTFKAIVAWLNASSILFWLFSCFVVTRFYLRFRQKYLKWKNSTSTDSSFSYWCYVNQINSK